MKYIPLLITFIYYLLPYTLHAKEGTIIISEIFYDSPLREYYNFKSGKLGLLFHHGGEYLEFYNPTNFPVDISNWTLTGTEDWEKFIFPEGTVVSSHDFLLLGYKSLDMTTPLSTVFPDIPQGKIIYQGKIILNNIGERLILRDKTGLIRDRYDGAFIKEGAKYKWDHKAKNGYEKEIMPKGKYLSIQRKDIRTSWAGVKYSRNDYIVAIATPFALSPDLPLPTVDWFESIIPIVESNQSYGSTMKGSASVSPSGAALYDIPLVIPQGTGGVNPNLSISYNSQISDGILGCKWGINGLSSIARVNKSMYFDNSHGEISLEDINNNGLALDGIRLVKIKDGTYRCENDPYSVVTYYPNENKFTVRKIDGSILIYAFSNRLKWQLTTIKDPNDNYVSLYYVIRDNECFIDKIEYTGNSKAGILPSYTLKFDYIGRESNDFYYIAGIRIDKRSLLNSISIDYLGKKIKEYVFTYSGNQLNKITEIVNGGKQSSSVEVKWKNGGAYGPGILSSSTKNKDIITCGDFLKKGKKQMLVRGGGIDQIVDNQTTIKIQGLPSTIDYSRTTAADINGDGKDDLILVSDKQCYIYFSTKNGLTLNSIIDISQTELLTGNTSPIIGDFNGDGINDILVLYKENPKTSLIKHKLYSITNNFNGNEEGIIPLNTNKNTIDVLSGDFNGDGLSDIAFNDHKNIQIAYSQSGNNSFLIKKYDITGKNFYTGDFNGDGKTDLVDKRSTTQYAVYYSTQTGFTGAEVNRMKTFPGLYLYTKGSEKRETCNYDLLFTDLNGDGKTEAIQVYKVFKPQGYIFKNSAPDIPNPYWEPVPGKSQQTIDAEVRKEMSWIGFRHKDGSYICKIDNATDILDVADLRGVGANEVILGVTTGERRFIYCDIQENKYVNQVINNGTKSQVNFSYNILSKDSKYIYNHSDSNQLIHDYIGSLLVIKAMEVPNGTGSMEKTTYDYEGLKFHTQGKGLLGFSKITATNKITGFKTIETYKPDPHFNMNPESSIIYDADNNKLKETFYKFWQKDFYDKTYGLCYSTTLQSTTEKDIINNHVISTEYTFDDDGIPNRKNVLYGENGSDAVVTTDYEYTKIGVSDFPNKISKETVISSHSDQPSDRISKEYTYDNKGNILSEIAYPGKEKECKSNFIYNSAGLLISKDINDKENNSRKTSYEYDPRMRFVTKMTNPLGQSITKEYDLAQGWVISEKNEVNKQTTIYEYGSFGELLSITDPWKNKQTITIDWAEKAGVGTPENAISFVKMQKPNTPYQIEFYDIRGNKLRTITEAYKGVSKIDYIYNNLGQLTKQSMPYSDNESPVWNEVTYDEYGRLITKQEGAIFTNYSYDRNKITTTTSSGQTTTQETNSLGNIVKIEDTEGNSIHYSYNSFGIKEIKTDEAIISIAYDEYGNKRELNDPNAGKVTYEYNAFRELISQTDAKGNLLQNKYDLLGRITDRLSPEGNTHYSYNERGLIEAITGPNNTGQQIQYNERGQIIVSTDIIKGNEYTSKFDYDQKGNNISITYPSGFKINQAFSSNGILEEIKDEDSNIIWKLNSCNSNGQITKFTNGNGLETNYSFDPFGRITAISTGNIQNLSYIYCPNSNNLQQRNENDKSEQFTYDNYNRLTSYRINNGFAVNTIEYAPSGNILHKSDVGRYTYHNVKINAVDSIFVSGKIPALPEQRIDYTVFNKIAGISQDSVRQEFLYGADEQRRMVTTYINDIPYSTKIYCGNYEKTTNSAGDTEWHYIGTPAGVTAVYIKSPEKSGIYYLCKDNLNSITALVDSTGNVTERYSYDAWGRKRNPKGWNYDSVPCSQLMERGYTMHEHMDHFGLINMNGRLYDPYLARVLSPDNLVIDPFSLQGLNRYAYCHNNPLYYTDPDGNNPLAWIIGGAIMVGKWYHDGRKANHGQANPLKWDYSKANFSIGIGYSGSGFNGYGGIGWNNDYGLIAGYKNNIWSAGFIYNGKDYLIQTHDVISDNWAIASKNIDEAIGTTKYYVTHVNWAGLTISAFGIMGGISEMYAAGVTEVGSAGLSTAISAGLFMDGGYRTMSSGEKLIYYLTLQDISKATLPSNIGAGLGRTIDSFKGVEAGKVGNGEAIGGMLNDASSFIFTLGTIPYYYEIFNGYPLKGTIGAMSQSYGYTYSLYDTGSKNLQYRDELHSK